MVMDITGLTSTLPADRTGASASTGLSREDFMKILLAEMSNQDPMNPVGNQEFLSQLAQMQTLEATTKLTDGIASLVQMGRLSAAGSLIGMTVSATQANGETITGVVDKVMVRGTAIAVSIDGAEVPLENVAEMWRDA